uniref:CR-type domain-containing protein n=1 Tax=Globodera rostochiensis TaxID=31243 RepID=A0A914GY00_GLORO
MNIKICSVACAFFRGGQRRSRISKRPITRWPKNTIQMSTRRKGPVKNSKNSPRPMKYSATQNGEQNTTNLAAERGPAPPPAAASQNARDFGWEFHSGKSAEQVFRDIFRDFDPFGGAGAFGKGRRQFGETSSGHDAAQEVVVNISFEEAARGVRKEVRINVVDACHKCIGTGVQPGFKKVSCPYCNGTGMITQHTQGYFIQTPCTRCGGQGAYNKNPCLECEGHGQNVQQKNFHLDIPAGIDNGQVLRTQVSRSTVYVVVNVAPSARHRREKEHIFTEVEISLAQASLGGTIDVPSVSSSNGNTRVHIPPGTSSHAQMVLKGKGIKRLEQPGCGDQILNIKVNVPKNLTARQRSLMMEFAKLEAGRHGTVDGLDADAAARNAEEPEEAVDPKKGNGEDKGGFKWSKFF